MEKRTKLIVSGVVVAAVAYIATSGAANAAPATQRPPRVPPDTDRTLPPQSLPPERPLAPVQLQQLLNLFRLKIIAFVGQLPGNAGIEADPFRRSFRCLRPGALVEDGIVGVCTQAATRIMTEILAQAGWMDIDDERPPLTALVEQIGTWGMDSPQAAALEQSLRQLQNEGLWTDNIGEPAV